MGFVGEGWAAVGGEDGAQFGVGGFLDGGVGEEVEEAGV